MIGVPKSLISAGPAEAVGYLYVPPTDGLPPFRVFYPAADPTSEAANRPKRTAKPIRWFEDCEGGVRPFLLGYAHMALAKEDTPVFNMVLRPVLFLMSLILPMGWLRIPGVYKEAEFRAPSLASSADAKLPLIVFSHGLTGTGQENFAMCSAWAKQGYIVACLHHADGSSCNVPMADGTRKYYVHGPSMQNYDPSFRTNQVEQRAKEVLGVCDRMLVNDADDAASLFHTIREAVDHDRLVVAGFSYGSATSMRAITMDPSRFCAAVLLDGWFHIDVSKSAGIEFAFPPEAFEDDVSTAKPKHLPNSMPSILIDSQQFQGYEKLFQSTRTLTKRLTGNEDALHVLPDTGHQNFCDIIFWVDSFTLSRLLRGVIGKADEGAVFEKMMDLTLTFLKKAVKK